MKLNEKTLLFIFVVLLILICIYYNDEILYSNYNRLVLLLIIISLYVFYVKFTNGRIEKFYQNFYESFQTNQLMRYYNKITELTNYFSNIQYTGAGSTSIENTPPSVIYFKNYTDTPEWHDFISTVVNIIDLDSQKMMLLEKYHTDITNYLNSINNEYIDSNLNNYVNITLNELNNAMEQIRNEYYSINPNDPNAPGSSSGNAPGTGSSAGNAPGTGSSAGNVPGTGSSAGNVPGTGSSAGPTTQAPVADPSVAPAVPDEKEEETPTTQYLTKLYLNKSKFHRSASPSINILKDVELSSSIPDSDSTLKKTLFNFYDITNGTDQVDSSDTSMNNLLKFNFANMDDLIDSASKRTYNFNINPVDFNIVGVSTDNNGTETGTDNNGDNINDVITDITADKEEEQIEFSPVVYKRRRKKTTKTSDDKKEEDEEEDKEDKEENKEEDKEEDKEEETESTSVIDAKEKQSIYNSLFSDIQFDEQRDGISYYFNKFFSSVQDIFN